MPRFLLVLCVFALAAACGGGGGSGDAGLIARTQLSSVKIVPDFALSVFPGNVASVPWVGDVPGMGSEDQPLRGVFRFSLEGYVPRGSTIASVTLRVPIVGSVGQPTAILPVHLDARPLATSALVNPSDVLSGDWSMWGPATEVGLPLDEGPNLPNVWEIHHEGGQGLASVVEAIVGTQAGNQPLTEEFLLRIGGTPNSSSVADQWALGGLFAPTNTKYAVTLQVNFVEPIF